MCAPLLLCSCVWSIYFEQRRAHEAALAALAGEAPPEDPFLALERKLAEVRRCMGAVDRGASEPWLKACPGLSAS